MSTLFGNTDAFACVTTLPTDTVVAAEVERAYTGAGAMARHNVAITARLNTIWINLVLNMGTILLGSFKKHSTLPRLSPCRFNVKSL
jgi:hypothetical protein